MNDEIKRREQAAEAARQTLKQAEAELEAARLLLEDQLQEHIGLARATLDVLTSIADEVDLEYPALVWARRDELAALCALYGYRIVEDSERKNHADLEEIA